MNPSNSDNDDLINRQMDTLFTRLTAIYGQLWLSVYQNEKVLSFAKREWAKSLKRFDNQTLGEALRFFRERKNFPPSLPQFVECCNEIHHRRIPPTVYKQPPIPPKNYELAREHLKTMLDYLNR